MPWAPALRKGLQVLSPAGRYWWQPWAGAAAFSKPFSRRAACPDPPLHQPGQHHGPPRRCKSVPWGACSALPGTFHLHRIFPCSGARKTVFLDPQRCSLGFETVGVFLCFWAVVMEKTFESPLDCKEMQPVHPKGDQFWVFVGSFNWCWSWSYNTWCEEPTHWKRPWCWERLRQEERTTKDEMVGWHHWLNGHGFGWTPGVGDGQGSLAYCSPWGPKESDTTEQLNWTECIFNLGWLSLLQGIFQHRFWIWVSCPADRFFTIWATRETQFIFILGIKWKGCEFLSIRTWTMNLSKICKTYLISLPDFKFPEDRVITYLTLYPYQIVHTWGCSLNEWINTSRIRFLNWNSFFSPLTPHSDDFTRGRTAACCPQNQQLFNLAYRNPASFWGCCELLV